MTVLITGGTGSIGLAVAESLSESGHTILLHGAVAPREDVLAGWSAPLTPDVVVGDIRERSELEALMRDHDVDAVVHAAAATPDATTERTRAPDVLAVNCVGALETLLAAADAEVRTFLYLGSIAAYGTSALTEPLLAEGTTPDRPTNIYEISKSAAEKAVLRVGQLIGINTASLRLGDIFGRWEHRTGTRQVASAIHQVTAHAATGRRSILPRPGSKPWTYSKDVGRAVSKLIACDAVCFDSINLFSPFTWSVEDWCRKLVQEFPGYSYEVAAECPANVSMYADNAPMSRDRLEQQLGGWWPEHGLDESFEDYLSWLRRSGWWTLDSGKLL